MKAGRDSDADVTAPMVASSLPPGLRAAATPVIRTRARASATPRITSSAVTGSADPIADSTDWPLTADDPRFPCSAYSSQLKYREKKGRLAPSFALSALICAAVACGPRIAAPIDPGTSPSRPWVRSVTARTTPRARATLPARKLVTVRHPDPRPAEGRPGTGGARSADAQFPCVT